MRDPRPFDGGEPEPEPDPEMEIQSENGGGIGKLAGQLMGLCFLIVAAICGILGMRPRKRK